MKIALNAGEGELLGEVEQGLVVQDSRFTSPDRVRQQPGITGSYKRTVTKKLHRLKRWQLVALIDLDADQRVRTYALTTRGREVLAAWRADQMTASDACEMTADEELTAAAVEAAETQTWGHP